MSTRTAARAAETCARKQTYLSERCALNAAWLIALRHHSAVMTAYRCPICADWHLTSHPKAGR